MTGRAYVNLIADEGEDPVRAAYPPAVYERLVAVKNKYDPDSFVVRRGRADRTGDPECAGEIYGIYGMSPICRHMRRARRRHCPFNRSTATVARPISVIPTIDANAAVLAPVLRPAGDERIHQERLLDRSWRVLPANVIGAPRASV
ncbi:MAG: BBE domain-containing protein [Chloroflexi bacterium]|nr:BBE domain-containing protein [Chloroflexota bacterium]